MVEGMEMIISAGTMTHDSAFTGSEGGRDSKNWGGVSEKMEKQSWHFFQIQILSQLSMQELFDL